VLDIKKLLTVLIVMTTQFIKRNIIQWSHIIPPISYTLFKSRHHKYSFVWFIVIL